MRRSQRLAERNTFVYSNEAIDDCKTLFPNFKKTEPKIQNLEGNIQSGSVEKKITLPVLLEGGDVGHSVDTSNCIQSNIFKKSINEEKTVGVMDKTNNDTQARKLKLRKPRNRGRPKLTIKKIKNKRTSVPKANRQIQERRSTAPLHNNHEIKRPVISIDNYLNPIRHPLLQNDGNTQILENCDFKSYNTISKINSIPNNDSLLPQVYPMHFVNQNLAGTSLNNSTTQMLYLPMKDANVQPKDHFPTPELTQTLDLESSTSTLSLPESLKEVFGCEDIRDVLKMDKIVFRMRILHLQTLAFVLNIQYEYLYTLVEKIMQVDTETLQKVIYCSKPLIDAFNCCPSSMNKNP